MTAFSDFTKKVYLKNVIINNQIKLIVFTVAKKHWENILYILKFSVHITFALVFLKSHFNLIIIILYSITDIIVIIPKAVINIAILHHKINVNKKMNILKV